MKNLSTLVGAIIKDPRGIDYGINYFLDYLVKNQYSELTVFSGGMIDSTKTPEELVSNPSYLKFSKKFKINPQTQSVFQDYLGHIFIGNTDFPKRNKNLILELPDFSKNSEKGLPHIITNHESIIAVDLINKNRRNNH